MCPTFAPGFRVNLSLENGMPTSKGHRRVTLGQEKKSLRMRALPCDGQHVGAALDAQGQESSSAACLAQLRW